ncbi:hypothetical protein OUZ56_021334 [Daphnia magna]|uniref:Uncharacterized protein n=1 Tax=Daphnia magna TaxID=35525 RepID=A0ABQ9ZHR4_9CRUS|nr:hypothetical protein OUZ56_021334 [Daphnia magna]
MYPKTTRSSPMSSSSQKSTFNGSVSCGYESETSLLPIVPMLIEANGRSWTRSRKPNLNDNQRACKRIGTSRREGNFKNLKVSRLRHNRKYNKGVFRNLFFGQKQFLRNPELLLHSPGSISPAAIAQLQCNSLSLAPQPDQDLVNAIDRFLLTETYEARAGVKVPISEEEARANKILNETTKFVGDRDETRLLWKNEEPNLPDNSQSSLAHFLKL